MSLRLVLQLVLAVAAGLAHAQSCPVTPASDALRQITQCLAGHDCRGRSVRDSENLGPGCDREIEVWSWHSDRQAVAIRDRKMCHSRRRKPPTEGFVHGLLLPMTPLCGVEDPLLYGTDSPHRGLWKDAWDAARARLPEGEIVLVINPPTIRSQTHLHIHLVRGNGSAFPAGSVLQVERLDEVWSAARRFAQERLGQAGGNYGIAVRRGAAGFDVLVEAGAPANLRNPESKYSIDED